MGLQEAGEGGPPWCGAQSLNGLPSGTESTLALSIKVDTNNGSRIVT